MSMPADAPADPVDPATGWRVGGGRSWYLLALLTLTSAVSLLDRQILTILAVDIKRDLGLNDTEIGLLYGTVFAVFYSMFSLPLGRLADGWTRTRQISITLAAWSACTAACAFVTGFASMAVARIGVAIGEAGSAPASSSLISDVFPRRLRGTVFAISALAATLGIAMSSVLGGVVVDSWNASFPGGKGWFGLVGWQAAFIAASIPGFALALLMIFIKEPPRGLADGISPPPVAHPFRRAAAELLALVPIVSQVHLRRIGGGRAGLINLATLVAVVLVVIAAIAFATGASSAERLLVYAHVAGIAITSHVVQWSGVGFGAFALLSWIQAQKITDAPAARVM